MATGKLAGVDITAGTYTQIYECPPDTFAVVTVNTCNRGNAPSNVRLTVSNDFPPGLSDYIEYDVEIVAKGVLERTGIVLAAGQKISARSSSANVTIVVYGIVTPTI